ncbi:MAG TPA: citrate lyase holo-[acyl-carrier protein] synthase [Sulfurospirillum arcachonense]|nr:citrate lyase holo-[acyl-carrier protein] synthase [Sulfurospirillum arcachonense]HIP44731.1 citrate lyase holo-[acyl-carrier protein] synthase [Sulfurospirillum arcachonense]
MKSTNWLTKVLDNRELRQEKQWELCNKYNTTVLSLTINIPGAKKDSSDAKYIYEVALKEIENFGLKVYEKSSTCKDTGYEALWALHVDAKKLKSLTCKVEESNILGRFMDIDVIDENRQILSREIPRKCYICETNAKLCARAQKHSIEELLSFISKTVDDYKLSL